MESFEELFEIAEKLETAAAAGNANEVSRPLKSLADEAKKVGQSFSGSWLGYHSRVYYEGLSPPPPGAHFSQEWGLQDLSYTSLGSRGDWREYEFEEVLSHIRESADNPDLTDAHRAAKLAEEAFDTAKSEIISIFETELASRPDPFLSRLRGEIENEESMPKMAVAQHWLPKGEKMTRDTIVLGEGNKVPPHIDVLAEVASVSHSFDVCRKGAAIARKAASHLERKRRSKAAAERVGTNVFIGHGRSSVWRELKDFVQDRLGLPWDEFNRVPVAGVTNITSGVGARCSWRDPEAVKPLGALVRQRVSAMSDDRRCYLGMVTPRYDSAIGTAVAWRIQVEAHD